MLFKVLCWKCHQIQCKLYSKISMAFQTVTLGYLGQNSFTRTYLNEELEN